MRRAILALLIVSLAACGSGDDDEATTAPEATTAEPASEPASGQTTVDMAGFAFSPREVEVQVGQEVVWANADDFPHTAEADDGTFDTGDVDAGATSAPVTFDEPGTYSYFCAIHNSMTGTLTVVG
jgi:plastocyanin